MDARMSVRERGLRERKGKELKEGGKQEWREQEAIKFRWEAVPAPHGDSLSADTGALSLKREPTLSNSGTHLS